MNLCVATDTATANGKSHMQEWHLVGCLCAPQLYLLPAGQEGMAYLEPCSASAGALFLYHIHTSGLCTFFFKSDCGGAMRRRCRREGALTSKDFMKGQARVGLVA